MSHPTINPALAQGLATESGRPAAKKAGWFSLLMFGALTLGLAGGGYLWFTGGFGKDTREKLPPETIPETPVEGSGVTVTTETVTTRPIQRSVEATGTLHGFEEVTVTAKVEGRVKAIHRDVGDLVKPGDLLIEIEPIDYEQAVQQDERALHVELAKLGLQQPPDAGFDLTKVPTVMQAQVKLDTTKSRLDRQTRLRATGSISPEDLESVTGDFRAAQAEHANQVLLARAGLATIQLKQSALAISRLKLAETKVLAPTPTRPIPGTEGGVVYSVTSRKVSEGTLIRAGTEVCKLVIDRTLKLRLPIPERYGPEIKGGQKVAVTTAATGKPTMGTVGRINPAVDPSTRTIEVEVLVPNPGGELKSGGFAKAAILTRTDPVAVTVPLTAPYSFAGTTRVFLVEQGKARDVPVTLGIQTTEWVEVLQPPLPMGAQVVTSGQALLADGTPVTKREKPVKDQGKEKR